MAGIVEPRRGRHSHCGRPIRAGARAGRWHRAVAALATTAAAVVTLAPAAGAAGQGATKALPRQAPAGNAFYAPHNLPKGKPGDLIWASPIAAPKGAKAWKVLYHSLSLEGRDIAVSGVVATPTSKAPKGGRTVFTWAHGTRGLGDSCAPSRRSTVISEIPGIGELISAGYTVAATDYEGLGTPGVHPYLVGDSEARGVLDIVRAARQLQGAEAGPNVIISGHSEGGQAAVFAGEIAPQYAPDLHILGVAAIAPATELSTMLPVASTLPDTLGFVVMGVLGFQAAYPTADPAPILAQPVAKDLAVVQKTCSDGVMKFFSNSSPGQVIAHSPADVAPFPALMQANTPGSIAMPVPMFVMQGDKDDTVLQPFTDTFVKRECGHGSTVLYRVYPGTDHYTVRDASRTDMIAWMADRVAGRPAPSTCGDASS